MENYFGRLRSLWTLLYSKWRWYEIDYDEVLNWDFKWLINMFIGSLYVTITMRDYRETVIGCCILQTTMSRSAGMFWITTENVGGQDWVYSSATRKLKPRRLRWTLRNCSYWSIARIMNKLWFFFSILLIFVLSFQTIFRIAMIFNCFTLSCTWRCIQNHNW